MSSLIEVASFQMFLSLSDYLLFIKYTHNKEKIVKQKKSMYESTANRHLCGQTENLQGRVLCNPASSQNTFKWLSDPRTPALLSSKSRKNEAGLIH